MEPIADESKRIKWLFDAALERAPEEREKFLANNCPEEHIRTQILSLLQESQSKFPPSGPEQTSPLKSPTQSGRALSSGTRLGPYEVSAFLGAGGMGEVYRARDTRLNRSVAIKVLPQAFATDRDRLRRFEQEARAVAALNHPNILALYDIGSQDGTSYVVSEFLEGSTLRQQLTSGALSTRKATEYAVQVARGLSAAHAEGVIHRDLKPENIFVTKDGRVKILDFGLAKSVSKLGTLGATTISGETEPGMVVGTAAYMSPEQVRGERVNHLSDIFSFGAVLYEMLLGSRAFSRKSNLETMNAILNEEVPELSARNPSIPSALSRIVRHCLEKNPEERFYSARDLAFDLEAIPDVSPSTTSPIIDKGRSKLLIFAIVLLGALAVGVCFGWFMRSKFDRGNLFFHQMSFGRGYISNARLTPDGTTTIYSAFWNGERSRIFMAREDAPESLPLDPQRASLESIWPPGEMLIHVIANQKDLLARMPITGGAPRPLWEDVSSADVSPNHQVVLVKESAGNDHIEYPPGTEIYATFASISCIRWSPDGRSLAIIEWPVREDDAGWVMILDARGQKKAKSSQFSSIRGLAWSPNSKEVWFTAGKTTGLRNLYALGLSGTERLVYQTPSSLTLRDISATGRVLFTRDDVRYGINGKLKSDAGERDYSGFDFSIAIDVSPDGQTLLFEEGGGEDGTFVMYIRHLDGLPPVRLGTGSAQGLSPDGKWVLACTGKSPRQLSLVPVGAGELKIVTNDSLHHSAAAWFPDGKRVLFEGNEPGRPLRLYVQKVDGGLPIPLTPEGTSFVGHQAGQHMISPDGKSILAFAPDGSPTIYDVDGGSNRVPTGFSNDDYFIRWGSEQNVMYIDTMEPNHVHKIYRLDVKTGKRVLWKEISITDPAGFGFYNLLLTPDGKSYFYTYSRELSTLFLVDGLK